MMDDATMVAIIDDTLKKHHDVGHDHWDAIGQKTFRQCMCGGRARDAGALRNHQSVQVYAALRDAVLAYVAMSGGLEK